MRNPYSKTLWQQFRSEVIEMDGRRCQKCARSSDDGVVLQVHHKFYLSGKLPWEYEYSACETLCKGCHAEHHGIVRPSLGWVFLGKDELSELSGTCECCGTTIRHVFHIFHPHWEPLAVGTFCCDRLTQTTHASSQMEEGNKHKSRLERFMRSSRWEGDEVVSRILQKRIKVEIFKTKSGFKIFMNGYQGKKIFLSLEQAKQSAFAAIDSGKAKTYLEKQMSKRFGGPD